MICESLETNIKILSLHRLVAKLVVLDMLFFPYFRLLHVSFSAPVIFLCIALDRRKISEIKLVFLCMLFLVFSVMSVIAGYMWNASFDLHRDVFGLSIILLYMAYYYFYIRNMIFLKDFVFQALRLYLWMAFAFAVLFILAPQSFFNIRVFWQMNANVIQYKQAYFSRYIFLLSDPNNCSCAISSVLFALLVLDKKMSNYLKIVYASISLFTCVVTLSATGFVVMSVGLIFYFFIYEKRILLNEKILKLIILCGVLFFAVAVIVFKKYNLMDSIFGVAIQRISNNLLGGNESSGSIRLKYWIDTIRNFEWYKYVVLGRGATVRGIEGFKYPGYSGHFQLILYYGLISYISYMYIFFRNPRSMKWKSYICLFPALICFSVNVGLEDYRTSGIFALVAAMYHSCVFGRENNA
ncbi:MAG: O-antigen ligase family protein [Lachnospiraceae bacterium]|nr:O-antigen ligase family protein [Lachnospiraceae bacterium]